MIDADERALMAQTVRGAIADALAKDEGAGVDGVLATLGWREMLADEPDDAIEVVFGALGATNATATALDDVVAAALGQEPRPDLAVLLPGFGAWSPPGRLEGERVDAHGLATRRAAHAREILVVCGGDAEPSCCLLPAKQVEVSAVGGVDPDGGLHAVRARGAAQAGARLEGAAWPKALALGRRAVAYQMAGACRAMLELARAHALEREQFGGPIARFQAVRHRLAEALVALEALEATLDAARDQPVPDAAALAKAVAGRTARTLARNCQQVLGGIGFTTEHAFHRFLKRTMALEGLFGTADAIVLDVGRGLLSRRSAPTLIEL